MDRSPNFKSLSRALNELTEAIPPKPFIITIPGSPLSKARPRFSQNKGKVRVYASQRSEKEMIHWQIKSRIGSRKPLKGPIHLEMTCVFVKPRSWPKKKNPKHHTVKPDLDNLLKWIGDAGNNVLWYDDRQIVSITCKKIYGEESETQITVEVISDE